MRLPFMSKCHKDGCHSAAEFHVGLEVQCLDTTMLQAPTTLKVCKTHMRDAGTYVLSPANKSQIATGLVNDGMTLPDFRSAVVVFVPIRAAENNFNAAREAGTRH